MNYTREQIAAALDYAVLSPMATFDDIMNAAIKVGVHGMRSLCVAPVYVRLAKSRIPNVTSVIAYPHGNTTPTAKLMEATTAIADGATELDVVINYGRFLSGEFRIIEAELRALVALRVPVKAIIETTYFDACELQQVARLCVNTGVRWLKTSTGLVGGATVEAVEILQGVTTGTSVGIKASGGIKTYKQAARFLDMGCILGSSCFEALLPETHNATLSL